MKRFQGKGTVRRAAKILFAAVVLISLAAAFCGVRECAVAARLQIVPAVLGCGALAMVLFAVMAAL